MLHYPEVQKKVQNELDGTIDGSRLVDMNDRNNLPYTHATLCVILRLNIKHLLINIQEIQRNANILAQNLIHQTTRDVIIDGYHLPKGTAVIPQISVVLLDSIIFPHPEQFRPDRFIDNSTKQVYTIFKVKYFYCLFKFKRIDAFVPFSVGARQCLGESLAKMELFLIFANLLHKFHFMPIDENAMPSLEHCDGFTAQPHPFHCRIRKR